MDSKCFSNEAKSRNISRCARIDVKNVIFSFSCSVDCFSVCELNAFPPSHVVLLLVFAFVQVVMSKGSHVPQCPCCLCCPSCMY